MKSTQDKLLVVCLTFTLLSSISASAYGQVFVKKDATGRNDGTSWANAFTELRIALNKPLRDRAIWVAKGAYSPADFNGDRTATFTIPTIARLYGGFAGTETELEQRDLSANPTVLSGDLNGNDGVDVSNCCIGQGGLGCEDDDCEALVCSVIPECCDVAWTTACAVTADYACASLCTDDEDNSYHVVTANSGLTSLLDGFIITGGNANSTDNVIHQSGGGLYSASNPPVVRNCTFMGNKAGSDGGGALIDGNSDAPWEDCLFLNNVAFLEGGGLFVGTHDVALIRCTFEGNVAVYQGGGVRVDSLGEGDFYGCYFKQNRALVQGGGASIQGPATFVNCIFSENRVFAFGGAIHAFLYGSDKLSVTNGVFFDNVSTTTGGGVYVLGDPFGSPGSLLSTNSIYWNNRDDSGATEPAQITSADDTILDLRYNDITAWSGTLGGVGNFAADPLFVEPSGSFPESFKLSAGSPCIDAGDNTALPPDAADLDGDGDVIEQLPWDFAGLPRRVDDPRTPDTGQGSSPFVDLGPFEFQAD